LLQSLSGKPVFPYDKVPFGDGRTWTSLAELGLIRLEPVPDSNMCHVAISFVYLRAASESLPAEMQSLLQPFVTADLNRDMVWQEFERLVLTTFCVRATAQYLLRDQPRTDALRDHNSLVSTLGACWAGAHDLAMPYLPQFRCPPADLHPFPHPRNGFRRQGQPPRVSASQVMR